MKGGLSKEQKEKINFFASTIFVNPHFTKESYVDLKSYMKQHDGDIHNILERSQKIAEQSYEKYIDAKATTVAGVANIDPKVVQSIGGLKKAYLEAVAGAENPREYKERYFVPALRSETAKYDLELRKSYRELAKENRRSMKGGARGQDFGI